MVRQLRPLPSHWCLEQPRSRPPKNATKRRRRRGVHVDEGRGSAGCAEVGANVHGGSNPRGKQAAASAEIELLEEVVALVVDDDEGGKVLDLDAPDRLHAELGIF